MWFVLFVSLKNISVLFLTYLVWDYNPKRNLSRTFTAPNVRDTSKEVEDFNAWKLNAILGSHDLCFQTQLIPCFLNSRYLSMCHKNPTVFWAHKHKKKNYNFDCCCCLIQQKILDQQTLTFLRKTSQFTLFYALFLWMKRNGP